MSQEFPDWLPDEVKEWFSRAKAVTEGDSRYLRLSTDPRMIDVWKWFESGRAERIRTTPFPDYSYDPPAVRMIDQEVPSPTGFLVHMAHAAYFPGKPNDMSPKQRTAYLEKVRKHAESLIELLGETQFDRGPFMVNAPLIPPEEAESVVLDDLRSAISWSQHEMGGLTLAYGTEDDGSIFRHNWNFPNSALVQILCDLVSWTMQDDYYSIPFSVKPVRQSGIQGRKSAFLARLYESLKRYGMEMPFAHYASAANVALDLLGDDELDEESARRQIRRMLERGDLWEPKDMSQDDDGSLPF